MEREIIRAQDAPTPVAHYCQGVVAGETVYAAGQIASDYKTGVPPEAPGPGLSLLRLGHPDAGALRPRQPAQRLSGRRLRVQDVVKAQVSLTDLNEFRYFDQVWKEFFPSPPPRTTVHVGGLLVPGCRVEIDLIAVKP